MSELATSRDSLYEHGMQVFLAHHWIVTMRGGEKVLEEFCRLFTGAPIMTIAASPIIPSPIIARHLIKQSALGRLPMAHRYFRYAMPLFPQLLRSMRVDADLLLSSDASLIKGISKTPRTRHVCYCYSPPRYLWDMQQDYARFMPKWQSLLLKICTSHLRSFDRAAAQRVDGFIAVSDFVAWRIRQAYGRDATTVYPPIDVDAFASSLTQDDYYLVVSALTHYKRIDLAIQAFNRLGLPLVIIGDGPMSQRLKSLAASNITFLGHQPADVLKKCYQRCKALIFPGVEDFGLAPLEAQASGRPVIALARGGALETVLPGQTGILFQEQNPESLIDAVLRMESGADFDPQACLENARRFRPEIFRARMRTILTRICPDLFTGYSWQADQPG